MFNLPDLKDALKNGEDYVFSSDDIKFTVKKGATSIGSSIDVGYLNDQKNEVLVTFADAENEDFEALSSASDFMALVYALDVHTGTI